jgi:hypothetical protein
LKTTLSSGRLPTEGDLQTALSTSFTHTTAESVDGWGNAIRYRPLDHARFMVSSAGPDGVFDTSDDLSQEEAMTQP